LILNTIFASAAIVKNIIIIQESLEKATVILPPSGRLWIEI